MAGSEISEKFGFNYLLKGKKANDSELVKSQFLENYAILEEHPLNEILAARTYLVACYRETENLPFMYMLSRGSEIILNELPSYYRYFLLPEFIK